MAKSKSTSAAALPSDRLQGSLRQANALVQVMTPERPLDFSQFDNDVLSSIFYMLFDCVTDARIAADELLATPASPRARSKQS